jgi:hypothetical protein
VYFSFCPQRRARPLVPAKDFAHFLIVGPR